MNEREGERAHEVRWGLLCKSTNKVDGHESDDCD